MAAMPKQFPVMGLSVHLLENYPSWLLSCLEQQQGIHVVTLNAEMVMQAETNPTLATIIQKAELVIPDGAGVVLYLWLQGKAVRRCPGIELAEALIEQSVQPSAPYSLFFYGGKPGVASTAAMMWTQKVDGLAIAGSQHGYLSPSEQQELQQTLLELQPRLIFVGLGVPRQELWIAEHRHLCPQAIWIGVGGSLDIWAGITNRAPAWIGNIHLEWLYRLYQEPWRWRRMLALPKFAWRALIQRFA